MNNERKTGGFSFFALWFGAAVSLAEIMTGSLIAPLGIKKGITVVLAGHLAGCLILALTGVIGFREKKPSLISSRISMGKYGSYIISVFNIVQLIGWTAIMLIQCTRSIQAITQKLFGISNFAVITVIVGILVAIWALNAEKGIHLINNIAVVLLIGLSAFMLVLVLKTGQVRQITESISFGTALELSFIMPLSWVPLISDYTMKGKSGKGSFFGSFTGYFFGSSFMYVIGLVSAVYSGTSDPISTLSVLNMGFAALIIVIFATVTTTFLDVFSAVFSTLNLAGGLSKKKLIFIYTGLGTLLALFFPMEQYQNFLYMLGSVFAPAFSVIIIDYFIFKKDRSAGRINIPGIIAAIIGTAAYYIVTRFDLPAGSSIPAIAVTAAVYIAMRSITNKIRSGDVEYAGENR